LNRGGRDFRIPEDYQDAAPIHVTALQHYHSYSPAATLKALDSIADEPVPYKISHFVARIFFRGIYFPPKGLNQWLRLIVQNRASVYRIVRESFTKWHGADGSARHSDFKAGPTYAPIARSKASQEVA
jgi:hypothetical protein